MIPLPNPFQRDPVYRTLDCQCGQITPIEAEIPHYYPIECLGCHHVWSGAELFTEAQPMTENYVYMTTGMARLQSYLQRMAR